jgi:opacity protein-like surface antigen
MKKFLILLIVFAALIVNSNAQSFSSHKNKFTIGYEVAIPGGDLLSKTSWAGGRMEYGRMLNEQFSVGLGLSWNSFSEYVTRTTYQKPDGSGAVTTDLVKEIYSVPITVNGRYYIKGLKHLLPYAGVGIGTQYSDQTIYFNIFSIDENNWGFVVRPEVGLVYPFSDQTAIYFCGTYNYATNKNEAFKIDNLQHFALSLGFTFGSR